jgi:hypothetical protein
MATLYDQTALFQLRTDGNGANIGSAVKLSLDDDSSPCEAEIISTTDGQLQKTTVRAFYFPDAGSFDVAGLATARVAVLSRLNAMATACRWKPPVIKPLPRGGLIMPNMYQNFGDLQLSYKLTTGIGSPTTTVAMANCCLYEFGIDDDTGKLPGLAFHMTFAKVLDQLAVTV